MHLMMSLILLIGLNACIAKPQPPSGPECGLVAVNGINPYLHCKIPNTDQEWDVELPTPNPKDKYICTHIDTYVAAKKYAHDLNDWINANCKGQQ